MGSISSPPALSAAFKSSFAYKTVKDRLPVILTKAIDTTHRQKHEIRASYGEGGSEDLKSIVHKLSELRYRLTTDKPLLPIDSKKSDVSVWNKHLEDLEASTGQKPSWFKSAWLDVECYFYRKIQEAFETSQFLNQCDPFLFQKEQAFVGALEPMLVLSEHMNKVLEEAQKMSPEAKRENLEKLLQVCLWGNKFDLSISSGEQHDHHKSPVEQVDELRSHILVNDLPLVVKYLLEQPTNGKKRVDIVLDNAGMELFGDLCLGEFLLSTNLCDQVVFHGKNIPWFVSDTTCADFYWTLEMLCGNTSASISALAEKWQKRLDDNTFRVEAHPFWTLPFAFNQMPKMAPDLWQSFNENGFLIIFKGDLNYRKLVGDLAWPSTTPLSIAVQEFRPNTPFTILRTLKADVITGMKEGEAEGMTKKDEKWMVSGNYALIEYCGK